MAECAIFLGSSEFAIENATAAHQSQKPSLEWTK